MSFFQVLSVTLDEWSDEDIDAMVEVGGNAAANAIYEAFIPDGSSKPGPDASHDDRMRFIRFVFYIFYRIILSCSIICV